LINGIKQSSRQVLPGQFIYQTSPSITGTGSAQLVIRDANGQQRTVNFSLYGTTRLLKPKLSDWSINLGVSHLDYAIKSFHYDHSPVLNASYRYGLSNDLTLESHIEYAEDLAMGGVGFVQRLPMQLGLLNGSYSYSSLNQDEGSLYSIGYSWNNSFLNFSLSHQQKQGDFGDIASWQGTVFSKRTDQVFLGINTPFGQLGSSYIRQQTSSTDNQYGILSWSYVLPALWVIQLNYNRDLSNKSNSAYLSLSIPMGRRHYASVTAQNSESADTFSATLRQSAAQDEKGWAWQANASRSSLNNSTLQGQLQRYNQYGEWSVLLEQSRYSGERYQSATLSGTGSLLLMQKSAFLMRQSLGAFALVSTDGVPDIPIKLEHRTVGRSNQKGLFLLRDLNAYQHNMVTVDAIKLPLDYKIDTTEIDAVPQSNSGVYVVFPMYRVKSFQFIAVDEQQQPISLGASVWNTDHQPQDDLPEQTIVGRDGMIFLENPKASKVYILNNDHYCKIDLPNTNTRYGFIDLGTLPCLSISK
ncbi:MAG: fimbria/pilus outer membrane usher protein, partial [Acinetobacter sp.]